MGTYEEALKIYEMALSISLDTWYPLGQAAALLGTARVEYLLDRLADARAHASDASNLFRRIENPLGEAQSLALRSRIEATAAPELSLRYNAQAQLLYDMLGVAPS
jgi:hypothetical protein